MKIILIIFVALSLRLAAQDHAFTNTQQSLIHLNPSFSGSNGGLRYQGIYRDQWINIDGRYKTFYNSVDAYVRKIRGGIGLSYMHDDQAGGTLKTDRIDLSYAQHFSLLDEKLKIIPSVQFSYFQKTLDQWKLTYGSQIDPRRGFAWGPGYMTRYVTTRNIDLSAGLVVNYKHFYIGGTVFHINQPDEGLMGPSKLPVRLSLFTSYNLFLGDRVLLNAICRLENQNHSSNLSFSINALFFKHLIVETGLAAMGGHVSLGFRQNYFTICGSYIARDSYEIAASFNLRNKDDRKLVKDFERW
jgi:type IX secretion system PorP/SprF family membrane protein